MQLVTSHDYLSDMHYGTICPVDAGRIMMTLCFVSSTEPDIDEIDISIALQESPYDSQHSRLISRIANIGRPTSWTGKRAAATIMGRHVYIGEGIVVYPEEGGRAG